MKARVFVTLKPSVFDPQGHTIVEALHSLGYGNVADVRQGKFFEIDLNVANAAAAEKLATEVADFLVGKGMPFREAHEVVGAIVRQLLGEGRDFSALTTAEWRRHSALYDESVHAVVTADASVRARNTPQSTQPQAVSAAIEEVKGCLRHVGAPE